jgi:hypothetical protein
MMPSPSEVRRRLAFDIERLAAAADRMERVDAQLHALRRHLQDRACSLSEGATGVERPESDGLIHIQYAKAQATAELARKATLRDVLTHSGALSLIASMAVTRWVAALRELTKAPAAELQIKAHIDTGRLAYRTLSVLRPKHGLLTGCGHLTSAVVVAEFVHPDDAPFIEDELEVALDRGRTARGIGTIEDVVTVASKAIRAGAELLESMALEAEPAAADLLAKADAVEATVEASLQSAADRTA